MLAQLCCWYRSRDRTVQRLPDDGRLSRTAGEDPDLARSPQRAEAHRAAPRGQPIVAEVPRGGGNRVGREADAPRQAVGRCPGLVHADMSVGANAEQREVAPVPDRIFVRAADYVDVAREIQTVEARRREIDAREEEPLEHLVAPAGITRVYSAEFVEQEHFGARERYLPRRHRVRELVVD